jgi:MYXO-CTERM domain-containing protein
MKAAISAAVAGGGAAVLLWVLIVPGSTGAYTISSIISHGCHEEITSAALRTVRVDLPTAAPLPVTANDQAFIDDVQFTLEPDMRDLGGAALMVSVRDNDLKGRSSTDLTELGEVHGNPDNQDEHCLRSRPQDEPDGSQAAVNDCRAFIRGRVVEALAGLDSTGAPDPAIRAPLSVFLALRGKIDVSLPVYYLRIGQAIHAVEDSFTHTYRTPDGMQITAVMNWIDVAQGAYVESRDGPAHATQMDVCSDPDEPRTTKRRLATEASVALLRATLDPQRTEGEKMAAVDGILDTYVSYSPGCTFANGWCDAQERQYKDKSATFFGCSSGGSGLPGTLLALLGVTALFRRRKAVPPVLLALLLAGAVAFPAGNAGATEPTPAAAAKEEAKVAADKEAAPPPPTVPVPQPGPSDPSEMAWGGYIGLSGSVDKPAAAIQLGVRLRLSKNWTVGWDVESNPWVSVNGPTFMRAGTLNTYGTVILRFPLAYENFNLRTTVNLGISYLLIDLYGAPKGSLGLYGAIYPLGLEWKVSRVFLLIINPLGIAVPMPQLKGVPLTYPQYRFSIGLGFLAG